VRYADIFLRQGSLNLSTRSLSCIPSILFEIHLGITPKKLSDAQEPDYPGSSRSGAGSSDGPSWFDQRDLEILKLWNNDIIAIQPEIYMFGSLKTIDVSL
jgi:hypothetical protein